MNIALAVDVDPDYIDDEGKSKGQDQLSFACSRDGMQWVDHSQEECQIA